MQGVIFDEQGMAVRDDIEVRDPCGEVMVRVHAAGVCHSDDKVLTGATQYPLPLVMGHEGAGVVQQVGAGVANVAVGDPGRAPHLARGGVCVARASGLPTCCRASLGVIYVPFTVDGARP